MRLSALFELALLGTAVGLVGALIARRPSAPERSLPIARPMRITMPVQWNGEIGEA